MSLKNQIRDFITNNGPKTDSEIATHFNLKRPSVRRTRGEMVKDGALVVVEGKGEKRWQVPSGEPKKEEPAVEAAPRFKHEPDPVPADKKDWRATGFTF